MGGDGGTKAVHRSYLRGAGSASTTGDAARSKSSANDPIIQQEEVARSMHFCALSDQPLNFEDGIVICPYGKLYNKEAAIEALMQRKQAANSDGNELLGKHIRGLKDLHDVRFLTSGDASQILLCPVTGRELNGRTASFALIPGTHANVNVVSEYAMKQLSEAAVLEEYDATEKIQIAPPANALVEIKKRVGLQRETEANEKQSKKRQKKIKRQAADENSADPKKQRTEIA